MTWYLSQAEEACLKVMALREELTAGDGPDNDPDEATRLLLELESWQERFRDSLDEISRL